MSAPGGVVVAGLGSLDRCDDAVGPLVAARVAAAAAGTSAGVVALGPLGDPLDLLGLWDGAALAVVVDAVRSGAAPGSVSVLELAPDAPDPGAGTAGPSTHGIGLAGVWRLARAVGQAPARVVVVAVEGADFGHGSGLSPAVAAALPDAARRVVTLIEEVTPCA